MANKRTALTAVLSALMLTQFTSCSSETVGNVGNPPAPESTTAGVAPAVTEETPDAVEAEIQPATTDKQTNTVASVKGNLYSTDGKILVYSDENGNRIQPDEYKIPFANLVNEMSEGYDFIFDDKLKIGNPTPVNNNSAVGQSVKLTVDAEKQNAIYQYMQNNNLIGSVVVMRTDGSLMAEVSYPSYDPAQYAGIEHNEDLAWGTYGNKAFQNFEPGSCFKIMSEVIADKNGVTVLSDEGQWEYGVFPISNWDWGKNQSYPIAERTLNSAFVNSSNIFFAKAFDRIGADTVLSDLSSIFHFGVDDDIECDFGSIENNIEIYCDDDLRRSAFGQSYVLTCPLFLAALGREAAFGDMVKPFVVQSIVDTNDCNSVLAGGTAPNEVIASIPQEYRQNLLDGMAGVASGLSVSVPDGYSFIAKTGTAETWEGDFLYITGCVKNNNDTGTATYTDYSNYAATGSYIIVMQIRNPEAHGLEFASQSSSYYNGIVNAVLSS